MMFSFSCSTKKNTFTRRVYHNLTAHYNAYFNGKEALKEGVTELGKKNKDDYSKILPVFELGTKADAQSVYNLLDRSLEKGSIVVQKHSIFIKGVEYIRWIDDGYMLIGKSYYYKQEYDLAMQTFNFVLNRFKNNSIKYEAIIWKSMVFVQQGRLDDAEALLASIEKKIEKNKSTRVAERLYPLAYSDVLLKQEKYEESIDYLKQAVDLNRSKHIRTRLYFILAQTYQRSGNPQKSSEYFKKVINMNPIYDMEFAAKINLAKSYDVTMGESKDIKKLLNRMLRDEKNTEYLDQIYYALAEISLKENDVAGAIENLKKSAHASVSNDYQKSVSYLKLADLYFAEPLYKDAQVYYDSCVIFLPKNYPNYSLIENKKNTLNDLVRNLKIVELQDSLQMLAKLPAGERNKKIDDIIAEIIKEEQRKQQEEIDRANNLALAQQNNVNNMNIQNTGSWYFYNPSTMSLGYTDFIRKWGNRKYEDLWRLSNKTVTDIQYQEIADEVDSSGMKKDSVVVNLKDRNYYISKLPKTQADFDSSNLKICSALFNIGYIYKESLSDYDKAIDAFDKLEKRFPLCKQILPAYFNLYQIYTFQENLPKADYYKNLIVTKFPGSDYAQIILDPNYYAKLEERNNRLSVFYKETYLEYNSGNYSAVIKNADSVIQTQKDKILLPKFELLKALSIGKTQPIPVFETSLNNIVSKYPGTDVAKKAQEILDALKKPKIKPGNQDIIFSPDSIKTPETGIYKYEPEAFHFYISVLEMKNVNINEIRNSYSDINLKFFSTKNYKIDTWFLDDKHEVLNVNRFDNKNDAMDYMMAIENNKEILPKLQKAAYKHFVISASNYPVFYKSKDVNKYLDFFNKNYKK